MQIRNVPSISPLTVALLAGSCKPTISSIHWNYCMAKSRYPLAINQLDNNVQSIFSYAPSVSLHSRCNFCPPYWSPSNLPWHKPQRYLPKNFFNSTVSTSSTQVRKSEECCKIPPWCANWNYVKQTLATTTYSHPERFGVNWWNLVLWFQINRYI